MRTLIVALCLATVLFWDGPAEAQGPSHSQVVGCLTGEIVEPRATGEVVAFSLLTADITRGRFSKNTRTVYLMFLPNQLLVSNIRVAYELDPVSRRAFEPMISMLRTAAMAGSPVSVAVPDGTLTLDRPTPVPQIDISWSGALDGQAELTCAALG